MPSAIVAFLFSSVMSSAETKQPGNGALPLPPPNLDDFDCVMFDCDGGSQHLSSLVVPEGVNTRRSLIVMVS